jgi:site-specific DNA recombinase
MVALANNFDDQYRYQPTGKYIGKRAAIYRRLSDEKQEEGWSLEFQEKKLREAIVLEGCTFDEKHSYVDTHTGVEIFERTDLNALRAAARRGEFDVLFLYKLDRFSRVGWQQEMMREELKRYGVTIVTLKKDEHADDDSPLGALIRGFYAFKAEEERNDILQRTEDGRRQKAESGNLLGGGDPLHGYRWNANGKERSRYLIDPKEAKVVRRIFKMAKDGMPLNKIADTLTKERIPTPRGAPIWHRSTLRQMLTNRAYTGEAIAYKWHQVKEPGKKVEKVVQRPQEQWIKLPEGVIPPLVDVATFEAVQQQLARNKQQAARRNKNPQDTLLRCGLVICGYCGSHMAVDRWPDGRIRYRCANNKLGECEKHIVTISAKRLDAEVWQRAVEIIRNPSLLIEEINKRRKKDPTKDDRKTLRKQARDTKQQIENCTKTLREAKNETVRALMAQELERLVRQQEEIERAQNALGNQQEEWAKEQQAFDDFVKWCDEERAKLDDPKHKVTYQEKRNACEKLGLKARVWRPDHKPQWEIVPNPPDIVNTTARVSSRRSRMQPSTT